MRCKNPFRFWLWSSCSQAAKRWSTSLDFNLYGTQFPCFWIIPMALRRIEITYWVTPNESANSSCVWRESSASFFQMKAENQNFTQMMRIWLENWHLRSRINLWCKHKFTNFDHHLPLQSSIEKNNGYHCWQVPPFKPLLSKFEPNTFISIQVTVSESNHPPNFSQRWKKVNFVWWLSSTFCVEKPDQKPRLRSIGLSSVV